MNLENEVGNNEETYKGPQQGDILVEPTEGGESSKPVETEVETEVEESSEAGEATEEVKPVRVAGKLFNSQEEADQYFDALERRANSFTPATPAKIEPEVELIDGVPAEELMFTQPMKVLNHFKNKAKEEARSEYYAQEKAVKSKQDFWTSFYAENKDLKGAEELVQAHMNSKWDEYKKLPADVAKKKIAEGSRKSLSSILKAKGIRSEEMSSSKPVSLGSSKSGSPAAQPKSENVVSFADQIRRNKLRQRQA